MTEEKEEQTVEKNGELQSIQFPRSEEVSAETLLQAHLKLNELVHKREIREKELEVEKELREKELEIERERIRFQRYQVDSDAQIKEREIQVKSSEVEQKARSEEQKNKSDEKKQFIEILPKIIKYVLIVLTLFAILATLGFFSGLYKISVPESHRYYEGMNYKEVVQLLREAGFVRIDAEAEEDLVVGLLAKENTVKQISIRGDVEFKKGEKYPPGTEIRIIYHAFKSE